MKRTLISLALLGLAGVASAAPTSVPFTATSANVPGATSKTWTADELAGAYKEIAIIGAGNQVSASAYADFTSFINAGTSIAAKNTRLGVDYGIYALFTSDATQVSPTNFVAGSGKFQLFMDVNLDTKRNLTGGSYGLGGVIATKPGVGTLNDSDDILLATSSDMRVTGPFASYGNTNPPPSFEFTFDNFALSSFGSQFFLSPNPFLITVSTTGTVIGLNNVAGNQDVNGTLNLTFSNDRSIPEPESLALVGLGLVGLVATRRRKTA